MIFCYSRLKVSIISEIPSQPLPGRHLCLQRQLLFFIIKYQFFNLFLNFI